VSSEVCGEAEDSVRSGLSSAMMVAGLLFGSGSLGCSAKGIIFWLSLFEGGLSFATGASRPPSSRSFFGESRGAGFSNTVLVGSILANVASVSSTDGRISGSTRLVDSLVPSGSLAILLFLRTIGEFPRSSFHDCFLSRDFGNRLSFCGSCCCFIVVALVASGNVDASN